MNEIVLLFIFAGFSNKMSKKPKKVFKVKDEWFPDSECKFFLQKIHLNIVRVVHRVVKTLILNTRAELTLLVTSLVKLIKRHKKQKKATWN